MVVSHNLSAIFTEKQLNINTGKLSKISEKLASGYKINRAADDAAGLSISEKMRYQIRGLDKAAGNVQDGISLVQVAEGALAESHSILQRMNELAVQAANDTNTSTDRQAIQAEIDQLASELDRVSDATNFNGEIYPLKGGKLNLTNGLADRTVTIKNMGPNNMHCDGKVYASGEEFSINVLSIPVDERGYNGSWNYYDLHITDIGSTGGTHGETDSYVEVDTTYGEKEVTYANVGDLKLDENGYMYYDVDNYVAMGEAATRNYVVSNHDWYQNFIYYHFTNVSDTSIANLESIKAVKGTMGQEELNIQAGALSGQSVKIRLVDASASNLGVRPLDVSSFDMAGAAMDRLQSAINTVSGWRSDFGATQNRLEHAYDSLKNTSENTQAAESRVRDTDIAEEMVAYSQYNILMQSGQAMLSQANQLPQGVLSLLN